MKTTTTMLVITAITITATIATAAEDTALFGSKDYYPSADHPIGWRGDGRGYYPGATPVDSFTEGTPTTMTLLGAAGKRGSGKEGTHPDVSDDKAKNIVWRTRMPAYGQSQPIIVGDKVFTTADPDMLICCDMTSGDILWQHRTSVFAAQGVDPAVAEKVDSYLQWANVAKIPLHGRTGAYGRIPKEWDTKYVPMLEEFGVSRAIFARLVAEHPYGEKAAPMLAEYDKHLAALKALKPGDKCEYMGRELYRDINKALEWIQKEYAVPFTMGWDPYVGWAFATPVSDGEAVYVSFGQGQSAAFDLEGKRLWMAHIPYYDSKRKQEILPGKGGHISVRAKHCPSPMIAGDILVVQAPDQLSGLNKKTGDVLWKRPDITPGKGYRVGSHYAMKLESGRWIIVTTANLALDATTGETVAELAGVTGGGGETGGSSIIGHGNRVWFNGQENRADKFISLAFTETDGKVEAKVIFKLDGHRRSNNTPILADGYIYRFMRIGKDIIKADDGSIAGETGINAHHDFSYASPILAGKTFFRINGRERRRTDLRLATGVVTQPLGAPGKVGRVNDKNMIVEGAPPPDFRVSTYGPEIYENLEKLVAMPMEERRKYFTWGLPYYELSGGMADTMGYGGFCATGNRVVLRTVSSLVCIGDPEVPYDWNPGSKTK